MSSAIYCIGIYFYKFAILIVSFFNGKAHKLRIGQREAFSVLKEKVDTDALYVWFHAPRWANLTRPSSDGTA